VLLVGSKRILRQDILRKTEEYLSRGGEIKKYRAGESAERADIPRKKAEFVGLKLSNQSDLNEVILAIDERKANLRNSPSVLPRSTPRKKVIYDDFGEPLREVWIEK
jgi:hypothetical protein